MARNKNKIVAKTKEVVVERPKNLMDKLFNLSHSGSTLQHEIWAGVFGFIGTAFLVFMVSKMFASAYPQNGNLEQIIALGTLITIAVVNIAQGFWSNLPYILVPSISSMMVLLAFSAQTMDTPLMMLGLLFMEGVLFLAISLLPFAKKFLDSIPASLRYAAVIGIGVMLVMMGLSAGGVITSSLGIGGVTGKTLTDASMLSPLGSMADFIDARFIVFVAGVISLGYFIHKKHKNAQLYTIIIAVVLGFFLKSETLANIPQIGNVTPLPDFKNIVGYTGLINIPNFAEWFGAYFAKFNLITIFSNSIWAVFAFITMMLSKDIIAKSGILFSLAKLEGRYMETEANFKKSERSFQVQGFGRIMSALFAGAPVEVSPESAITVTNGGRTGLTSIVYGACALLGIFLIPVFRMIPAIAVAPVLIYFGILLFRNADHINWKNIEESLPAILVVGITLFTWNLAFGMIAGIFAYLAVRVAVWKFDDIPAGLWVLGALGSVAAFLFHIR